MEKNGREIDRSAVDCKLAVAARSPASSSIHPSPFATRVKKFGSWAVGRLEKKDLSEQQEWNGNVHG